MAGLSACTLLVACGSEIDEGAAERITSKQVSGFILTATLYDQAVSCPAYGYYCYDSEGVVEGEDLVAAAERQPSAIFGAGGLALAFEIQRQAGGVGHLDLDLPLTDPSTQTSQILLGYMETDEGGEVIFEGRLTSAFLEVAESPACPCTNMRLEARFIDAGPDGLVGTQDDQQRRINAGLIAEGGVGCRSNITLPLADGLRVVEVPCPTGTGGGTGGGSTDPPPTGGGGGSGTEWTAEDTADVVDACAAGCNSTDGCASSDEGCDDEGCDESGGGCEGDTDSGCEGDSGGSGCEGDTASGCDGDAGAACNAESCRVIRRTPRIPNATLIAVLLLLGMTQVWRRGAKRRRRRRHRRCPRGRPVRCSRSSNEAGGRDGELEG